MSADETCDHHSVIAAPEGAQESVFQLAPFGGSVPLVKKVKYRVLRDIQMRGLGFHASLDACPVCSLGSDVVHRL